jgi:hypothetical protein
MSDERLTAGDYTAGLDALTSVCRVLIGLPVEQLRQANEHFQAIGPVMDPTAFMRGGGDRLREQRIVIDAACHLKAACESLRPGDGRVVAVERKRP